MFRDTHHGRNTIHKRGQRYVVAGPHGVVETTWDIRWALYRYLCCPGSLVGSVVRALS